MKKNLIFIGIVVIVLMASILIYLNLIAKKEKPPLQEKITMPKTLEDKKIAIIVAFKDFRDEEYFVPKEILEGAGAEVKTASNSESAKSADEGGEEDLSSSTKMGRALGADGGEVEVDLLVSDLNPAYFDAVVFIGGPGCLANLDNENSYKVAKETVSKGKVIAAICVSPIILAKAGVLEDKKATVWSSALDRGPVAILKENGAIYQDKTVVTDGKIITGNGPEASKEFGEAILKVLTGE